MFIDSRPTRSNAVFPPRIAGNYSPPLLDPSGLAARYIQARLNVSLSLARTIVRLSGLGGAA
jgi:hypothetical protein